jgi:hypothetical protein
MARSGDQAPDQQDNGAGDVGNVQHKSRKELALELEELKRNVLDELLAYKEQALECIEFCESRAKAKGPSTAEISLIDSNSDSSSAEPGTSDSNSSSSSVSTSDTSIDISIDAAEDKSKSLRERIQELRESCDEWEKMYLDNIAIPGKR